MRLTAFTDYSLRVLIYLAADTAHRATIAEIATAFDVKQNHLTKVVNHLARHGWVSTVRGKGGGLVLAHPPRAISIGRVVRDTEGAAVPAECFQPGGGPCVIARGCTLRHVLAEAVRAFQAVLDRYTLEDIARSPETLPRVLKLHPLPARRSPATR